MQQIIADGSLAGGYHANAEVAEADAIVVPPIAESLPVAPEAVISHFAAQGSIAASMPQLSGSGAVSPLSGSVSVPAVPALIDPAALLGVRKDAEAPSQAQASSIEASDAPVLAVASSAIDGVHEPAVEAAAAPGDHDVNPVLKTLQQLQVGPAPFSQLSYEMRSNGCRLCRMQECRWMSAQVQNDPGKCDFVLCVTEILGDIQGFQASQAAAASGCSFAHVVAECSLI